MPSFDGDFRFPIKDHLRVRFLGFEAYLVAIQNLKSAIQNYLLLIFAFCIFTFALLDHFVCPIEHRLRNRQADLLRRLEINDELTLLTLPTAS